MIYGVYANSDLVHWSPAKIFQNEIKVCLHIFISGPSLTLGLGPDHWFVRTNTLLPSRRGLPG